MVDNKEYGERLMEVEALKATHLVFKVKNGKYTQ